MPGLWTNAYPRKGSLISPAVDPQSSARLFSKTGGREAGTARGGKSTGDENMATLREAVSQLDTAIQHLEQALDASADSNDPGTAQLRSSLEEANSRSAELTAVAEQVALRLDRAVARVSAILES